MIQLAANFILLLSLFIFLSCFTNFFYRLFILQHYPFASYFCDLAVPVISLRRKENELVDVIVAVWMAVAVGGWEGDSEHRHRANTPAHTSCGRTFSHGRGPLPPLTHQPPHNLHRQHPESQPSVFLCSSSQSPDAEKGRKDRAAPGGGRGKGTQSLHAEQGVVRTKMI